MSSPNQKKNRGTTLLEILIAVALLLIIFLFITADLLQSSEAENVAATRTESTEAANYLLGVMRTDANFWSTDWASGPGGKDPCGNDFPPYTDTMTAPTWHQAPACASLFPDLVGTPVFQYMWNAQQQALDKDVANLTVWVQVQEGGRLNVYELQSTRTNIQSSPFPGGSVPTPTPTPTVTASGCAPHCPSPSPTPTPSHHASPSPTPTPSHTPTPTPTPSGTFE